MGKPESSVYNQFLDEYTKINKLTGKEKYAIQYLMLSHHGSKTASSLEFLNQLGAKTATISAGKNNRYGHPHKETLTNLKKSGYEIYRTDKQGFISIDLHKKSYSVTTKQIDSSMLPARD